jgi:hypothetical protein
MAKPKKTRTSAPDPPVVAVRLPGCAVVGTAATGWPGRGQGWGCGQGGGTDGVDIGGGLLFYGLTAALTAT